jgi:hypothetical protein
MAIEKLAQAIPPDGKFKKNQLLVYSYGNGLMLMMEQLEEYKRELTIEVEARYDKQDKKFFLIQLNLPFEEVSLMADYINANL